MRAFYPESGSVKFVIHDAHALGVTSVASSMRGDRVITGGADGKVRFWDSQSLKMISSLCEHKTRIEKLIVSTKSDNSPSSFYSLLLFTFFYYLLLLSSSSLKIGSKQRRRGGERLCRWFLHRVGHDTVHTQQRNVCINLIYLCLVSS